MGVPLVSVEGKGYILTEGYFLPPLAFSVDEAALLLLGTTAIARSFDEEYQRAAGWAMHKIESALPSDVRERVESLRDSLSFIQVTRLPTSEIETQRLMRRAILKQQIVRFRYYARYPDEGHVSLRDADPYALVFVDGGWFMIGYCHLRKDRRMFRLSRMEDVTLTGQTFERPANYRLAIEAQRSDRRTITAKVLFDEDAMPWVMDDRFFYIDNRQETEAGLVVTLRGHTIDQFVPWIMGWGRRVHVLEPDELRQRVHEEAQALAQNHAQSV
jgi:predicted DNA-binding transcriptional regulator YafY